MCLSLAPFPECGFGTCVNNSCVCNEGFVGSEENLFVPHSADQILFCDTNLDFLLIVRAFLLAFTIFTVFSQAYVIENWRQAKRLSLALVGYVLLIAALAIYFVSEDPNLFGINAYYTACISLSILVLAVGQLVFVNKYLAYLNRTFDFGGFYRKFANVTVKAHVLVAVMCSAGSACWISTCFAATPTQQQQLAWSGNTLYCVSILYTMTSTFLMFYKYLVDLQTVVRESEGMDVQNGHDTFVRRCRKQIPRVKVFGSSSVLCSFVCFLVLFLGVILPGFLKIQNSLFILTFCFYEATNLFIIRANSRKPMPCADSNLRSRASSRFAKPVSNIASALKLNSANSEKESMSTSLLSQDALDSPEEMSNYL